MTTQERPNPDDPEFEVVASLPFEEAVLLAGRLRADGIDAHVYPDQPDAAYGKAVLPASDILVHTSQANAARTIIEQYR
jgi:hypothetical protein